MDSSSPTVADIRAARADLNAVSEEIRAVDGYGHFLAGPTFDDVAQAARDDPLVYVAAAPPGGLALVVRDADVTHIPLPRLTADAVQARVEQHRAAYLSFKADRPARWNAWAVALDATTRWLWDEVMGPVVEEVLPAQSMVLVSGGLLGLLPLHAAWTEDTGGPDGRRYALDSMAVSYVPNARSLTAARRLTTRDPRRLLAVADPSDRPLRFALAEASLLTTSFDQAVLLDGSAVDAAREATVENVSRALADVDVAHFACHGVADLLNPLDSRLDLARGQRLRLRDLLDLRTPLQLRLVVLSACETSLLGTNLPDEVVSLPSGLLEAGVGGVVASLWDVPDRPTATLMAAFYWFWRQERHSPPAALRAAQTWGRSTTNEEKADFLDAAVHAGMFPESAMEAICLNLREEPNPRSDQTVAVWGAFSYVGA